MSTDSGATVMTAAKVCSECQSGMCVNCPIGLLNLFGTNLIDCGCPDDRHTAKRAEREATMARLGFSEPAR